MNSNGAVDYGTTIVTMPPHDCRDRGAVLPLEKP